MGDPPQLNVKTPKSSDVPNEINKFSENTYVDFLLLTAVECEFLSCFHFLQKPLKYHDDDIGIVYIGKMGGGSEQEKLTIGLMRCNTGSAVGGSAVNVQAASNLLKPKGVFCVGFCGGMNEEKAKLGDVVVSTNLILYAQYKATDDVNEPRGLIVPLRDKVNKIMNHASDGWEPPLLENIEEAKPRMVCGKMLSGPMLLNSKKERKRLLRSYPDAIAIEMEGEGVFSAAHKLDIQWVIVKGISDYADGTKDSTKDWKPYASMMAASLVSHVFSQPKAFEGWPRCNVGELPIKIKTKEKGRFGINWKEGFDAIKAYLVDILHLRHVSSKKGCIIVNVTCRNLDILEQLWDDYRSGHLNAVAEKCFITKQVKEELGMETIKLTTIILEDDYLACRSSLKKISDLPDQSSAGPSKKRRKRSSPGSVPNWNIREKKAKVKKANLTDQELDLREKRCLGDPPSYNLRSDVSRILPTY
ncbi:uncharacterized protein [Montipora foliosa]|uniref:uncharacterized protein n=1 Tax=Montipora foliosa TaxID=591990 RepID=UPI0035F182E2